MFNQGVMNIIRHISLEDEYIEKLKPYVEKHGGNFGAALRDLINRAEESDARKNSSIIDHVLLNWILNEIDDKLIPPEILDAFIDPGMINSMDGLERYINKRFGEPEWGALTLKYDAYMFPGEVLLEISDNSRKGKFMASILSQYLVKNSPAHMPLEVKSVIRSSEGIKVGLSASNKKDALKSLETFFGMTDGLVKTVRSRPAFWTALINRHILSNFNMVTIHRNYFEDLLADKIPAGEITIEDLAKKPIQEIPLKEMLVLIKEVYETSRIVDRVEIDNDEIILFHNYRTKEAIDKLKKSTAALLEANGHLYDAKSSANILILTHRSDVGLKINEIVESLKKSNNKIDQELFLFFGFLKGLEDIPDIPLSLTSLGRRIGRSLMQEYEKENASIKWDLENFQKALTAIDKRLHRESEWKADANKLLYTVRKCNIAGDVNTFDTYVCHTAREVFKGALNYAFGIKAELSIKHLISRGDSYCEVIIKVP